MKDVDNFEYIIKSGPTHIIKPKIIRLLPISILNPFLLINKKDIIKVFK